MLLKVAQNIAQNDAFYKNCNGPVIKMIMRLLSSLIFFLSLNQN